jgi:hypothetical protein
MQTAVREEEEIKLQRKQKDRKTAAKWLAIRESARQPKKELDSLLRDLENLSINDRRYGVAYFKALKLDPDIAQCFQAPNIQTEPAEFPRHSNIMEGRRPFFTQAHYTGPNNQEYGQMKCFECGRIGRSLRECHKIQELITFRRIKRDMYGKIVGNDG